jgi:hypothetical protein
MLRGLAGAHDVAAKSTAYQTIDLRCVLSLTSVDFDVTEAASFGPMMQRFAQLLREITGALRIYIGSLNEGSPHFHCHLLPRLPAMPNNAMGWIGLSDLAAARSAPIRRRQVRRRGLTGPFPSPSG